MPKFISEFKEGEIVDFPTNRKYEFVRALKSGGTGKTILMQDTMLNKFFVCKKYPPMQTQPGWESRGVISGCNVNSLGIRY